MRFAVVEGQKREASPRAIGTCPSCAAEMLAKCGRLVSWHWSHKTTLHCDPWWENETQWHRSWKGLFPADWQEFVMTDPSSGEKHIADLRAQKGLVVEFQHSRIHPEERAAREAFYGDMLWIVDGKRNELDSDYFRLSLAGRLPSERPEFRLRWWGRSKLLEDWCGASKPVLLDFGEPQLWRLLSYDPASKEGSVRAASKEEVVKWIRASA